MLVFVFYLMTLSFGANDVSCKYFKRQLTSYVTSWNICDAIVRVSFKIRLCSLFEAY